MNIFTRLIALLDPHQRRAATALLVLTLVGMMLETFGIGLIIPALSLITEPSLEARFPMFEPALAALDHPTHTQLIVGGMLALVGVYAIKTLFLVFLTWRQAHFAFRFMTILSQRLFAGYLRMPYAFHLQRNSAQLIRNLTSEVSLMTQAVIASTVLVTETLVLFGIGALLLFVEPLGAALTILTLCLGGYAFHHATKVRLLRWGEARQFHEGKRIQHLQQGLGGVKDIKLLGREEDFLLQYARHNASSAQMNKGQTVLQSLPRLFLELLAVIGLAILVLTMLAQGKSMQTLIPTLGLFAGAAFRLMPSVGRVLGSMQAIRYTLPAINTLSAELCLMEGTHPTNHTAPMPFEQNMHLKNIGYMYTGAQTAAITAINLTIQRGATVGFVGGSGAGKSTLIDLILGLLSPTHGQVLVDGVDIQGNPSAWQSQIGYVPQTIYLTDDTLRRNVAFGLAPDQIDEQAVQASIKAAQLDEFIASLPEGLDTLVGERGVRLSGGQRQRIGIARALYHDPPVLVLDEATSSLDTTTERGVMDAVSKLHGRKTILIVAHRLSTVAQCDRLYRLEQGRLVDQGTFAEVTHA